ncbi:MAG: hypothetical protein BK997_01460 [Candidatus Micrarchaeum sp. ARMAN-1]|nr:MAG: hypothetical protein BK997_01460 [Candidatus Micrarchaeum sp. ARMAN-1]
MVEKRTVVAISLALFILGAVLLAYGSYYNSRLGISLQKPTPSITGNSINASINKTESLLNIANRSSYLVFYPNLQKPYSYLAKAKSIAKEDPGLAATLLAMADNDTQQQIANLNSYRYGSLWVMIILTLISAYALYRIITYKDSADKTVRAGSKPFPKNARTRNKARARKKE